MYAKDYEHKENKTNEGNDMYLLFCIVIQTYRIWNKENGLLMNCLVF